MLIPFNMLYHFIKTTEAMVINKRIGLPILHTPSILGLMYSFIHRYNEISIYNGIFSTIGPNSSNRRTLTAMNAVSDNGDCTQYTDWILLRSTLHALARHLLLCLYIILGSLSTFLYIVLTLASLEWVYTLVEF